MGEGTNVLSNADEAESRNSFHLASNAVMRPRPAKQLGIWRSARIWPCINESDMMLTISTT